MCLAAHADPAPDPPRGYAPVHLPQCEKYTVPGVGTVCGYFDVENWKAVLRADAELTQVIAEADAAKRQAEAERTAVLALRDALTLRDATLDAAQEALALERLELKELDRRFRMEEAKPRWGTRLSWGIAIVGVTAAGVLGAVVWADRN